MSDLLRLVIAAGLLLMGWDLAHAEQQNAAPTAASAAASAAGANDAAAALYRQHCAACHGAARTGGMGPALLPESLARLRKAELLKVIAQGRRATQMPGFAADGAAHGPLASAEIEQLAQYLTTPVEPAPRWSENDIRASRRVDDAAFEAAAKPARPVWNADPLNLFVVVEAGDHHVSLVDGDKFEVVHRFASRFALHGGPKFSRDGRFVYFGSRDGWITKYDLWRLAVVAEVRAGLNLRNIAVSGDGRWVMAAG